jgi:lysophospholipid acyltransferase (LPLAT)-like uncharacterized protein
MKLSERLLFRFGPPLAAWLVRLLSASLRTEVLGEEQVKSLWAQGKRVIFPVWHDQLLLMRQGYLGSGLTGLASSSKDGELVARMLNCFGVEAVRGSSSRGGAKALRQLVRLGKSDRDLALTPDGPRGPRRVIKPGIAQLARLTGRPVVPVCFVTSRGHRFASWDRFCVPYPFARGVYVYGDPLLVEKDESEERFCERLTAAMEEIEGRGIARLEDYGVSAV